ncbi:OmpA family protein [Pseudomonas citronellolis]|uniref:OmpA family protein n=1 Tax=Pseudomonas citronellolis TaxID=53408 RepID=UPI0023E3A60C|nr:OmpA family protein [Pseudomonas citronellolis]MDF3933841.1 OmpA family protein [Pseudomonas citronellolis]
MRKRGGEQSHEIIVKRRGKKGHAEEHSSAWKVAFADFTLAMMALFMVLWIVQPRSALQNPSSGELQSNPLVDGGAGVFDGSSRSPLELDGLPMPVRPPDPPRNPEASRASVDGKQPGEAAEPRHYDSNVDLQELAALIRAVSAQADALANIEVKVVPQGLRVLIKDDQQRFMFERGSANLDPHFRTLLGALGGVLAKVDNRLILSGHTDAVQYRGANGYNNWNLSGDRALRARNVLVDSGLPGKNVLQVTAQADGMPLLPDDPQNGANRRIELLLLTDSAEHLYRQLFSEDQAQVEIGAKGAKFSAGQVAPKAVPSPEPAKPSVPPEPGSEAGKAAAEPGATRL